MEQGGMDGSDVNMDDVFQMFFNGGMHGMHGMHGTGGMPGGFGHQHRRGRGASGFEYRFD
jgi:hypothetical protein